MTRKLRRLRQCEKCPWKASTDPHEIPDGYSEGQHLALARTIAKPASANSTAPWWPWPAPSTRLEKKRTASECERLFRPEDFELLEGDSLLISHDQ